MKIIRVYHFQLCQLTHALKECDEVVWSRLGIVRFVGLLVSRSKKVNLIYLSSHFLFYFRFIFYFSIFRTTRVRVNWSCCHINHNLMA